MKITLALPKNKDFSQRLRKEISSANNIKDKTVRESVILGLKKIESVLVGGKSYLWDGEELSVYDYPLDVFVYHCGNEFKLPDGFTLKSLDNSFLMITMDANECTIGKLQGKTVETLWQEDSFVPKKHNKGGQSKVRFQRNRELALKQWFKKIGEKLKELKEEK